MATRAQPLAQVDFLYAATQHLPLISRTFDLAASANGRYVYIQHSRFIPFPAHGSGRAQLVTVVDLKTGEQKEYNKRNNPNGRDSCFLFCLNGNDMLVVSKLGSSLGERTCFMVHRAKADHANSWIRFLNGVAKPIFSDDPRNVVSFQYKTQLFVLLSQNLRIELGHFDIPRMSLKQKRLEISVPIKDGVAHNDRLYLLCNVSADPEHRAGNPEQILIIDLEQNYRHWLADTLPDRRFGFPARAEYCMDHVGSKLCVLLEADDGSMPVHLQLWTLDLDELQWTKLNFALPCCVPRDFILHTLPYGKVFVLGQCAKDGQEHRFHLYGFWLGVPSLRALALDAVQRALGENVGKQELLQIGLPRAFAEMIGS